MPKYKDCKGFIAALGTSVPRYRFSQKEIGAFMKRHMLLDEKQARWVDLLVEQSKISYRHSVIPDYALQPADFEFYPKNENLEPFPGVEARIRLYKAGALHLAAEAARQCLERARADALDVTHLIVVSCTGMYAPGLDIDLVGELGLSASVSRTSICFMGCYAAFNALKVASSIVGDQPQAKVLIVCVELCSIHFQKQGVNSSHLLSNMLFGDGASAALVFGRKPAQTPSLALMNFACDLFPDGKEEMTWEITDLGFVMSLTSKVPEMLKIGVGRVFERLLNDSGVKGHKIRHYAFHPGGPKVLEVLESICEIREADHLQAYTTLRDYGNMSSATLFFVLREVMDQRNLTDGDLLLSAAFGPGLTCESALMAIAV